LEAERDQCRTLRCSGMHTKLDVEPAIAKTQQPKLV